MIDQNELINLYIEKLTGQIAELTKTNLLFQCHMELKDKEIGELMVNLATKPESDLVNENALLKVENSQLITNFKNMSEAKDAEIAALKQTVEDYTVPICPPKKKQKSFDKYDPNESESIF